MRREVPALSDELILATWYGRWVDPVTGEFEGGPIDHDLARRTLDEWEKPMRLGRPKPDPHLRKLAAEAQRREDAIAAEAEGLSPGPDRMRKEADHHECVVATFRANERAGQGLYPTGFPLNADDVYAWHAERAERLRREADRIEAQRASRMMSTKARRRRGQEEALAAAQRAA